ncbi:MAG: hypothetical protein NW205_11075 [Hyphomicrobiaceae bacterium]|nr:hypothetical protein [Hyphomicrobiaceae bacterium]
MIDFLIESAPHITSAAAGAALTAIITWKINDYLTKRENARATRAAKAMFAPGTGVCFAPDELAGDWDYEVTVAAEDWVHRGTCSISVDGEEFKFVGVRTETVDHGQLKPCKAPWNSNWAQVCGDGRVRGEYSIAFGSEVALAYFSVVAKRGAGQSIELSGDYFWLAPRRKFGHIRFFRPIAQSGTGTVVPAATTVHSKAA